MRGNSDTEPGLIDVIKHTGLKNILMCEIGSFRGESAATFMATGLVDKIYCIDPWPEQYLEVQHEEPMSEVEADFDSRLAKYGYRVIKMKMTSDTAKETLIDNFFDLVYIDGIHQYENCKADILNYLPKIKSTGFIAGHDYNPTWPGVQTAVNEILGKPDAVFADSSWIKKK